MKKRQSKYWMLALSSVFLVGCTGEKNDKTTQTTTDTLEEKQVIVTNSENKKTSESDADSIEFDNHEYTYDVVTGATQTTFGSSPKAIYTKEEKMQKMFWSNQPPLGLLEGYYYKNEGLFTGNNYGVVEVVTHPETTDILNVEFTEFASESYYEPKYAGANKKLSDYAFFQADNTRTDETLVTVVNGITYVEKQMRDENRVTGDFLTVKGSSTSARQGFMPLAEQMKDWIREPYENKYFGYAKELPNGLIARLQVVTTKDKITDVRYDEYFADQPEKMTDDALKKYYRQSKYYSLDYNKETNNEFVKFSDKLAKEIEEMQTLDIDNKELQKYPSFSTYEELKSNLNLSKKW